MYDAACGNTCDTNNECPNGELRLLNTCYSNVCSGLDTALICSNLGTVRRLLRNRSEKLVAARDLPVGNYLGRSVYEG